MARTIIDELKNNNSNYTNFISNYSKTFSILDWIRLATIIIIFCILIFYIETHRTMDIKDIFLFFGTPLTSLGLFVQWKTYKLAKIASEISTLLPYRIKVIEKLAILFEDNSFYDDNNDEINIADELYEKHSMLVSLYFGDNTRLLLKSIRKDKARLIYLANAYNKDGDLDKKFTEVSTRYYNSLERLHSILYKSIRVRSNL